MKKFIILILLYLVSQISFSQITSYDWLRTMGNYNDDRPIRLYCDNYGNCKLVIETLGSGSSDTLFFTDTSLSGSNNFLIEFNSNGVLSSAFEVPDILTSSISDFQQNDTYMYSVMSKSTYWSYTYGNTTTPVTQTKDIFVTKQDTSGNPISLNIISGTGDDYASNIVIDNEGNIIITGYYDSPNLSFAGTTIGNSGTEDAFIAKYDSLGNELWVKRIFSSNDDEPVDLAVDDYGNIYYTQRTGGIPLNVDGNLLFSNNNWSPFLLKFDINGNLLWNIQLHGDHNGYINDIEIDNSNSVLLAGSSNSSTFIIDSDTIWSSTTGTGLNDDNSFFAKLDSNGNLLWSKYVNNTGSLDGNREPTITYDNDDNVYFTFHLYNDSIIFDIDTIITSFENPEEAPYLCKFNAISEKQWIIPFGTEHNVKPNKIVVDDEYNIFISGRILGIPNVQFDSLISPCFFGGSSDVFLLKASQYIPDHTKQFVNLNQGWSIISSYVDPYVPDCDSVFTDVAAYMVLMKNEIGETFWPMYNVNTIGDLQIGEGYIIKMYNFNILEVSGIAIVPEWSPLALLQDWNIIGYLRQNSGVISTMLNDISQNIVMVKNGNGLIYWPTYGIDNIGNMNPGEGYQIKMLAADTLLYPAN
ncbi:MAG: hypothetical protein HN347_00715 [Bacteroidetes bacterium]|nr:hypothetical protein [Bacteroidota bacterium]